MLKPTADDRIREGDAVNANPPKQQTLPKKTPSFFREIQGRLLVPI